MHDNYDYDIFPINKNIVLIKKTARQTYDAMYWDILTNFLTDYTD